MITARRYWWYWYVDDSEMKCRRDDWEKILEHLNAIEENVVVFTKEEQEEESLPVLDLKQNVNREIGEIELMYRTLQEDAHQHIT